MPTTLPAMKARLGSTDYYILSMKAQELSDKVKIPRELEGWEDMSVEERYQRDLNYNRVKSQIAPYFANDNSRFFGAVIVAAMNFDDNDQFEPLSEMLIKGVPNLYKTAAASIGFLTFKGGEVLVPLDGQHRIKAIEFAVSGRDERGREIASIETPCTGLAQEDVTVILVPYESRRARKIFTRVNRYAKPTTTGQNIVTDDDDIVAVLTREVSNELIGARIVKFSTNTLNRSDRHFTTLAIIYNCNIAIITENFPHGKVDKTQLPSPEKISLYRKKVHEVWEQLLENIEVFRDALGDTESKSDDKRRKIRDSNLLGKPVAQECLVRAFVRLVNPPTNLSMDEACNNLNRLPWAITEENLKVWDRVLWTGGTDGRIITKNRNLSTDLVAYLAEEKLSKKNKTELLERYRVQFPDTEREGRQLPRISAF
ncbi:MAG: DGQHR domain-containing protein [Chloroflexota bacterium]|nr:DGQHR domain-containing protein [Chloroflexota bacterium]MDE2840078.1 DGQHR domain-containing protein [Chloroflexota bacterium]